MKSLENSMAAVAFAEAGEFDMARSFMEPAVKTNKKVILSITDLDIKPKLVSYALDLCKRAGGQLEVLHILKPSWAGKTAQFFLNPLAEKLTEMGITYKLAFGNGSLEDELIRHTANKRNILFVVLKSIAKNNRGKNDTAINVMQIMDSLKCPVVVFSDKV